MLRLLQRCQAAADLRLYSIVTRVYLRLLGVEFGRNLKSRGMPVVRRNRLGAISLGHGVMLGNNLRGNLVGVNRPCVFTADAGAKIEIGNYAGLSGAVLHSREFIRIGSYVLIGANATIIDHDFHPHDYIHRRDPRAPAEKTAPVIIGDDVLIGASAFILKGVTIGPGAIVGAGAVVTCAIPARTIWAGNPAKFISMVKTAHL